MKNHSSCEHNSDSRVKNLTLFTSGTSRKNWLIISIIRTCSHIMIVRHIFKIFL